MRTVIMSLSLACALQAQLFGQIGTLISHNGSLSSSPSGTGEVDVLFNYPVVGLKFSHEFHESAAHVASFTYAPGFDVFLAGSFIDNETTQPWAGFRILLEGSDFTGFNAGLRALEFNPVADTGFAGDSTGISGDHILLQHVLPLSNNFTVDSSSILRSNDQGTGPLNTELTINFGIPLAPTHAFTLKYFIIPPIGNPAATGFTATFTPIPVPEPATVALLAFVGSIALVRRRRGNVG